MARRLREVPRSQRKRSVSYLDATGRRTEDPAEAVQGEVIEYGAHPQPVRRTRFFLSRSELPWLPVSEPAFLLWVFVFLLIVWVAVGIVLLT